MVDEPVVTKDAPVMGYGEHLSTIARKMTTSSAMNPALLLCLIVFPVTILTAGPMFYAGWWIPAAIEVTLASLVVLVTLWQLIYFTIKTPDRLQQERHLENMYALQNRLVVKDGGELREYPIAPRLTANNQIEDKRGE